MLKGQNVGSSLCGGRTSAFNKSIASLHGIDGHYQASTAALRSVTAEHWSASAPAQALLHSCRLKESAPAPL